MSRETKVWLKSSDDKMFEVDEAVAHESPMLKNTIEEMGVENPIPIPMVRSYSLAKVIEYCKYHLEAVKLSEDKPAATNVKIKEWDRKFMEVDCNTLCDLIKAAHYLDIKKLLDLTCQTLAETIGDKTAEEVRKTFNMKNDFTPKEEAEVRRQTYDPADVNKSQ